MDDGGINEGLGETARHGPPAPSLFTQSPKLSCTVSITWWSGGGGHKRPLNSPRSAHKSKCSQQHVGWRGRPKRLRHRLLYKVKHPGGNCRWLIHLCQWSVNKSKLEAGIIQLPYCLPPRGVRVGGGGWLQQSQHMSLGWISEWFFFLGLHIHPSLAPVWSSTATYPCLKLQQLHLWVAYNPCNDKVQMWIHCHGSESY